MKRSNTRILCLTILLLTAGIVSATLNQKWGGHSTAAAKEMPVAKAVDQELLKESLGKMPLYFIENKGQLDNRAAYYVQGRDKSLYFTPQGITFALSNSTPNQSPQRWNLKLDFIGANRHVNIVGKEEAEAVFSYFTGAADQWKAGLKTYKSIVYENLWPGIDLVYSGTVNQVKYEFIVQPGANPDQIKLAYRGASSVKLNAAGSLEVATPVAGFNDDKPVSFQDVDGEQVEIATTYALEKKSNTYGFRVSNYDRSKPLVIDPVMIMYCGYIGGSGSDLGTDIVVDNNGFAYVTGFTNSLERSTAPGYNLFPVKVGPDLSYNTVGCPNCYDAFVAKVRTDGSGLIYCGYIGGKGDDKGLGITLDSQGRAYVVGTTTSSNFPVKIGPKLVSSGGQEGFIARVNANGTGLEYCGYIGGSTDDGASDVAVDQEFSAYVVGSTDSTDFLGLMNVVTSWDWSFNGGLADVYALKINATGTAVPFGGYVGGSEWESGTGIDIDAKQNVYISGFTQSSEKNFPVKVGPDLTFNGSQDGFIARINQSGMKLDYCGYIGGSGDDTATSLAVTNDGEAYLGGDTDSDEKSFPVVVGPDLTFNGKIDAFVAKVKQDGSSLIFCGYIGGAAMDSATGIGLDAVGNAYLAGSTTSDEKTFPVKLGPDLSYNGNGDAFVAKVSWNSALLYCGYIGGTGNDYPWAIATNKTFANSDVYVVGRTDSTEAMGFPLKNGPDLTYNGSGPPLGWDAFVAKVSKP